MGDALSADIGCGTERGQMGTHQASEVQNNASQRKGKCHPAVLCDALCLRPVR